MNFLTKPLYNHVYIKLLLDSFWHAHVCMVYQSLYIVINLIREVFRILGIFQFENGRVKENDVHVVHILEGGI